jgi:ABC-2 type transport system ATP-binding protein/lipopolysaccharide transport system ATP-binding protein
VSAIHLQQVCLDYTLKTGSVSLKKFLIRMLHHRSRGADPFFAHQQYRALDNITLSFKTGDRVAILGQNGAGKSTLLRVLAGIYKPQSGQVQVKGSISSLFDIDLGLNPEATGYENIMTLCILRGLSREEALASLPDIEAFTELGSFLKAPIRTYSAGMRIKLAYAVATSGRSDIFLVDEIIGVGDAVFMKKALHRFERFIHESHILVLTSHALDIVKSFCNKAIVLEAGKIAFSGDVSEAIGFYETSHASELTSLL